MTEPSSSPRVEMRPNPGPQTRFLAHDAYEVLYGGAAGGGKSWALLAEALRYIHEPHYSAILFRRTFPELEKSLIERSRGFYPQFGGRYSEYRKSWRFPSGALVYFGYLDHEDDVQQYQSAEFQFIGFDELTHFSRAQYVYMLSRARSSHGLPVRVRAATNPGGPGHEWVMERWAPWLDPDYKGPRAQSGETLWYTNDTGSVQYCPRGTPDALTRSFVRARVYDNPKLLENDPQYVTRLRDLDPVTRERLLNGDWSIKPVVGTVFGPPRTYRTLPDRGLMRAIGIDLAYSKRTTADWSVAVLLALHEGDVFVEDVIRERVKAPEFQRLVRLLWRSAHQPDARWYGYGPELGIADFIRQGDDAVPLQILQAPGDKYIRAQPFAKAWNAGRVFVPEEAPWLNAYLSEHRDFSGVQDAHDDQVDASGAAFDILAPYLGDRTVTPPAYGTPEWARAEEDKMREAAIARVQARKRQEDDGWGEEEWT